MTPEEAKEKWCPFARVISVTKEGDARFVESEVSYNKIGILGTNTVEIDPACRCIADRCMAWRDTSAIIRRARAPEDGVVWILTQDPVSQDGLYTWKHPRGYCGLAGKL